MNKMISPLFPLSFPFLSERSLFLSSLYLAFSSILFLIIIWLQSINQSINQSSQAKSSQADPSQADPIWSDPSIFRNIDDASSLYLTSTYTQSKPTIASKMYYKKKSILYEYNTPTED